MAADPKPEARIRDPDLMRLMHHEAGRECCITGSVVAIELHHVLPRAHGGDDVRENLVFLHRKVHQAITVNNPEALKLLGEHIWDERPDVIAYLVYKMGKDRAVDWMQRRLLIDDVYAGEDGA